MYEREPKSASEILRYAKRAAEKGAKPTYIICGKPGPTGKTWLWDALVKAGHNAIEISESIGPFVDYRDDKNHMLNAGPGGRMVIIILNRPLDAMWKL